MTVTTRNQEKSPEISIIEQAAICGDLAKLTGEQRVAFYNKVCESLGLNPFTQPFSYIVLNGKLTLYAKKDCTEQLRKINGISVVSLEDKMVDDIYVVTAKVSTKDGRTDQATGAVTIGHLKGEMKANAIMKAETKAKRRATLSISGMGWVDESEVDSIPNAKTINIDPFTGEEKSNEDSKQIEPQKKVTTISESQADQLNELFDKCSKDSQSKFNEMLQQKKIKSISLIPDILFESAKKFLVDKSFENLLHINPEVLNAD